MCNMSCQVDHSKAFPKEEENHGKQKKETYAQSPTNFCTYFWFTLYSIYYTCWPCYIFLITRSRSVRCVHGQNSHVEMGFRYLHIGNKLQEVHATSEVHEVRVHCSQWHARVDFLEGWGGSSCFVGRVTCIYLRQQNCRGS